MKRTIITIAIALASFSAHADFARDSYNYQHGDVAQRAQLSQGSAGMAADLDGATHSAAIHETASSHPDTRNAAAQAQEAAAHAARYGDMSPKKAPAQEQSVQKSAQVGQPTIVDHVPASVTNISEPVKAPQRSFSLGHNGGDHSDKQNAGRHNAASGDNNAHANANAARGEGRTNAGGVNHY